MLSFNKYFYSKYFLQYKIIFAHTSNLYNTQFWKNILRSMLKIKMYSLLRKHFDENEKRCNVNKTYNRTLIDSRRSLLPRNWSWKRGALCKHNKRSLEARDKINAITLEHTIRVVGVNWKRSGKFNTAVFCGEFLFYFITLRISTIAHYTLQMIAYRNAIYKRKRMTKFIHYITLISNSHIT